MSNSIVESKNCPKCKCGSFSAKRLEGIINLNLIRLHCWGCHFEWYEIPIEEAAEE